MSGAATACGDWWEATPEETRAQKAARDAVMTMDLFPDLNVALKKSLGYGPHVDMLQHFVYWFHPRKPKMQHRWTMYKTFDDWHEECGLTDRQVKKGRKRLLELGLLAWKRGQYGRVHYRVDWVALVKILNPDAYGVPIDNVDDDLFDDFDEPNPDALPSRFNPDALPSKSIRTPMVSRFNPDALPSDPTQETTTEDYSEDYLTEETLLQSAAGAQNRATPLNQINKEEELEEEQSSPGSDKRHSESSDASPQKESTIEEVLDPTPLVEEPMPKRLTSNQVAKMMQVLCGENEARRVAIEHLEGREEMRSVAVAVCRQLGEPEDEAERYETRLPEALEILREEIGAAA